MEKYAGLLLRTTPAIQELSQSVAYTAPLASTATDMGIVKDSRGAVPSIEKLVPFPATNVTTPAVLTLRMTCSSGSVAKTFPLPSTARLLTAENVALRENTSPAAVILRILVRCWSTTNNTPVGSNARELEMVTPPGSVSDVKLNEAFVPVPSWNPALSLPASIVTAPLTLVLVT